MPDAGDSDHDDQGHDLPQDWAGVFAALPQEAPAPDGWQRLQARLPEATAAHESHGRMRWPLWLAAAASLALAVVIPLRMQPAATPEPLATTPAPDPAATPPAPDAGVDVASGPISTAPIENNRAITPTPTATARVNRPRTSKLVKPSQRPIRTVAQPADATRIAASDERTPATIDSPEASSLEPLYAQSAQLEGLLAMARDDRVSNGTAAALSDNLDARVASIDAALTRTDVTPQRRSDLWRDRIDTLRQLVGIETTQRLYSARGQQFDAALVSID